MLVNQRSKILFVPPAKVAHIWLRSGQKWSNLAVSGPIVVQISISGQGWHIAQAQAPWPEKLANEGPRVWMC